MTKLKKIHFILAALFTLDLLVLYLIASGTIVLWFFNASHSLFLALLHLLALIFLTLYVFKQSTRASKVAHAPLCLLFLALTLFWLLNLSSYFIPRGVKNNLLAQVNPTHLQQWTITYLKSPLAQKRQQQQGIVPLEDIPSDLKPFFQQWRKIQIFEQNTLLLTTGNRDAPFSLKLTPDETPPTSCPHKQNLAPGIYFWGHCLDP